MPVAGRKPKEGPKRNRMPATHEWTDVADVPFAGVVPVVLPAERPVMLKLGPAVAPVLSLTRDWWVAVCSMPHCTLWTATDWQFALATALVADMAFRGVGPASTELRQRERVLGMTHDARRDLRVRYVKAVAADVAGPSGDVISLDDRRRRIFTDAT